MVVSSNNRAMALARVPGLIREAALGFERLTGLTVVTTLGAPSSRSRTSRADPSPPAIDGFSSTQRLFLGFGQIWRQLAREEALRQQVVSDNHSPGEFRANGTVRNMDEWYEAFGVRSTARLYLPPDQRVRIW